MQIDLHFRVISTGDRRMFQFMPAYRQRDVLRAICQLQEERGSYGITLAEIASAANCCWRTAQTHAQSFERLGLLERERASLGPGRAGAGYVYTLRDENAAADFA